MSFADEVLADHERSDEPTNAASTDGGEFEDAYSCLNCDMAWPCAAVRLATQLRAAEQVVEAARNARETDCTHHSDPCGLAAALDEYDKGDRQ